MELLLNGPTDKPAGFMIPIPQYPLYTATISEYNAEKVSFFKAKAVFSTSSKIFFIIQIGYYLDEDRTWGLSVQELERAYEESLEYCDPKAICIINPGNPTGQVLSLENIQQIIKWAYEKRLFILADEV